MRERTPEEHKAALAEQMRRDGGALRPLPDGPMLETFSAHLLAQAIEHEVGRAQGMGHDKIRVDMTHDDAMRLASYLRRAVLAGV